MNKAVIQLLANALESGEYKQIPYPMHTSDGFDLSGVLVDVYRKQFGGEWVPAKEWCSIPNYKPLDRMEFLGSSYVPPEEVLKWLGLQCNCPRSMKDNSRHLAGCSGNMFFQTIFENSKIPFADIVTILKRYV